MPANISVENVSDILRELPEERRREVLDFIEFLRTMTRRGPESSAPRFADSFGVISPDTADAMERVIADHFERVDINEWPGLR
ncbi:MAG: hypothetical protein NTY01_05375 [Verrucomicrobia bacterium]|nr:hypothetical protein [Verrucomicrobiota bacterium]